MTDNGEIPANLADKYQEAKESTSTKWQVATKIMLSPIPKYMCINQEETKASDQVEHVSLQESIVWKVCSGWEEGMRLAHRQREIGEAAMRMQTTSEQLTLVLKLGEGEKERYRAWRCYMGQAGDIEGECMDEGVIGSDA